MLFFEINLRERIDLSELTSAISIYMPERSLEFYPSASFYNDQANVERAERCVVYELSFSEKGFKTYFRGQVFELDHDFNEFLLAIHLAKYFDTDVVIGNFTHGSSFLLVDPKGAVYRVEELSDDDGNSQEGVFEIDYSRAVIANDLMRNG